MVDLEKAIESGENPFVSRKTEFLKELGREKGSYIIGNEDADGLIDHLQLDVEPLDRCLGADVDQFLSDIGSHPQVNQKICGAPHVGGHLERASGNGIEVSDLPGSMLLNIVDRFEDKGHESVSLRIRGFKASNVLRIFKQLSFHIGDKVPRPIDP